MTITINKETILELLVAPEQFISWLDNNANQWVGYCNSWTNCPINNFIVDILKCENLQIKVCHRTITYYANKNSYNSDKIEISHKIEWLTKFIEAVDDLNVVRVSKEKASDIIKGISCIKSQ